MAQGLYIHIPFCTQRCLYCDFYSTTLGKEALHSYVRALCQELTVRNKETNGRAVSTIYIGGGTPSLLSKADLSTIFQTLSSAYTLGPQPEITIEVNPDDVTSKFIDTIQAVGINRISVGVQSLNNLELKLLRRRHTAEQAEKALLDLAESGFHNLSIDLIYGIPGQSLQGWEENVHRALALPICHLSTYALTYEEGTPLYRLRECGNIQETDEELSRSMYYTLIQLLETAGFEHYEISNFALPGKISRHNYSYWSGVPYIGFGPGAHSFNGKNIRRENDADLTAYMKQPGNPPFRQEILTDNDRRNEMIFTSLRTRKGLDLDLFEREFGKSVAAELQELCQPFLRQHLLIRQGQCLKISLAGLFLSDLIMSDLMSV